MNRETSNNNKKLPGKCATGKKTLDIEKKQTNATNPVYCFQFGGEPLQILQFLMS